MRVMTFNLRCDTPRDFDDRWDNRKSMVYYVMNEYKCDVIGTQEVKDNMFFDLKENVKGYEIIGEPRCKRISSERNNLLLSKKYTIQEHKTFWLSETPYKVGSKVWYSYVPRICTTAVVKDNNGKKIRICNTHLDNLFSKTREYGLKKLMEVIDKEQEREELPIILMGDFNDTPDSELIRSFTEGKLSKEKLVPVQDKNKTLYKEATRDKFKRTQNGVHIDYIFVSKEIEVMNVEIIKYNINGKYPSDHYPLMAEIKIK
ncbi:MULTISPECIES: endonuclease/exonuclease/phosphatase family protein [unclassified Clostridium]|uniref:endonuclease/exonuclease/phosphatase family protein n=1 Tax=unclassified Clostridium TaxID=2614128 RepID=UPI000297608D|nr:MULTISPECIES: endonuclease/exonuclease/phosphatase family protein [unclassified Clostridium]EKQ50157.1 MAG: metal-dependent hydrolase [Clostridium sp. Maddingley MBC34-26]